MKLDFSHKKLRLHMLEGGFGLEKESLRTDSGGFLSNRPHPFSEDKNIDRDFAESQTEFITDVFDSVQGVCDQLESLHTRAYRILHEKEYDEYFWPFSNPPSLNSDNDIAVARFEGRLKEKNAYRQYLAEKYGKRKMLYSGIHFNFNFSDAFLNAAFSQNKENYESIEKFREKLYLGLAAKAVKYSWLIVYLMSASPVFDSSFFGKKAGTDIVGEYSSARCGKEGYWNDFCAVLDYSDLEKYADSIRRYVHEGKLRSPSELYCPVRVKPNGENSLENLLKSGIGHIEFRLLDLNPFSPSGVMQKDIEFLHLFFVYLLSEDEGKFGEAEQKTAVLNTWNSALLNDKAAEISVGGKQINIKTAAKNLLNNVIEFFSISNSSRIAEILNYQKQKLCGVNRYADIVVRKFSDNYIESGTRLSRLNAQYFEGK